MWKTMIASGVLLGASLALAQGPAEPYPGQRNHAEPPAGWTCSREAEDPAHLCFCSGMQRNDDPMCHKPDVDDPNTEEDESQPAQPPEDAHCKTYCWRSYCTCKQFCDT